MLVHHGVWEALRHARLRCKDTERLWRHQEAEPCGGDSWNSTGTHRDTAVSRDPSCRKEGEDRFSSNDIAGKAVGTLSHLGLWSPDPAPGWPLSPAWHRGRAGAPGGPAARPGQLLARGSRGGVGAGARSCPAPGPTRAHVPAAPPGSGPTMQRSAGSGSAEH